jgi:hypothetical protein
MPGDLISNRHPAAGQTENDYLVTTCIFLQLPGQPASRFVSVFESCRHFDAT